MITIQVAFAKGATMFERHVGIETEKFGLNAYSSTPSQIEMWMIFHQARLDAARKNDLQRLWKRKPLDR